MPEVVIDVQQLSKRYELGTIGTGSFRQDVKHWWLTSVRKKENPFFGTAGHQPSPLSAQFLWALDDVSFKINRGQSFGIIGNNGAGKSTLLKIISRIVQPTKGFVRGKGKVGSILEVGTGFNPELSGRENIYISGYLLGMSKQEIKTKFDEIVAFSGIEKFLDTPVKRYSSGMYVRLAFAVAAHLESEILIIDEVLAVGDADFQKRCLGKMDEVSRAHGRTILFVSHNLQAIANLCTDVLWLQHGKIKEIGQASLVVNNYIASSKNPKMGKIWSSPDIAPGNELIRMKSIDIKPETADEEAFITVQTPVRMQFEFWCFLHNCNLNINVILFAENGECVFNLGSPVIKVEKAVLVLSCIIPGNLLNNLTYTVSLKVIKNNSAVIWDFFNCTSFEVEDVRENMYYFGPWQGIIRPSIYNDFYIKHPLDQI